MIDGRPFILQIIYVWSVCPLVETPSLARFRQAARGRRG